MDDVVGTGPEEHLMSDFEHMFVVPSLSCVPKDERSRKPDAVPIFKCPRRLEAMNVNNSNGSGKPQKHMDHISEEKDPCPIPLHMVHKPIARKKCDEKSRRPSRSRQRMGGRVVRSSESYTYPSTPTPLFGPLVTTSKPTK